VGLFLGKAGVDKPSVAPLADLDVVEGDNAINAAEASDGVTLSETGEVGAEITVEFQSITRSTTVDCDGSRSMAYEVAKIASGTYDSTVTITTAVVAGNRSTSSYTVHVDTDQDLTLNPQVGSDDAINSAEQAAGSIVRVYTGEEESFTALTDNGIGELKSMSATARRSTKDWHDFLDDFASDTRRHRLPPGPSVAVTTGPVPLLCCPKCSFKPPSVRMRLGFSSRVLNGGVVDCRTRLGIRRSPSQPAAAFPMNGSRSVRP